MRQRIDVAIVSAVAAIVHFTYCALRFGSFYFPDSFAYLDPAKQLLLGHGFVGGTPPEIETIRTPGYPLLLALFGAHTVPIIVLQHVICVALAAALFLFTMRRTGSRPAAYVAALAYALDVPSLLVANKLLTETLFTAILFTVFVLVLQAKPRTILIAILTGTLVLVRPIAIFFFAVLLWRIPRRQWIAFVLAAVALPAGWAARNWMHTGVCTVSSIGNINLLAQRAAGVLALEDEGDDFRADLRDEQQGLVEDADDWIQQTLHIDDAEELPVAVRARFYGPYALRILAHHPAALLRLTARGVRVNLFDSDWDALLPVSTLPPRLLQRTAGSAPILAFAFALAGTIALWRRDRALAIMIILTAGYFIVISAGGEADARFRVPVAPEMAIAAGVGVAEAVRFVHASFFATK